MFKCGDLLKLKLVLITLIILEKFNKETKHKFKQNIGIIKQFKDLIF